MIAAARAELWREAADAHARLSSADSLRVALAVWRLEQASP